MTNLAYKIDRIHAELAKGNRVIHPEFTAYEFIRNKIHADYHPDTKAYQNAHFATRDGYTLSLRCSSNYFGSLIDEADLAGIL